MLDEMERALHDALCIVKRTLESTTVSPCIHKLSLNAVLVYFDEDYVSGYCGGIKIYWHVVQEAYSLLLARLCLDL